MRFEAHLVNPQRVQRDLLVYAKHLTRDHGTAEDLVQHAFLRAIEKSHLWHGGAFEQFIAWLKTILKNAHTDMMRREVSRRNGNALLAMILPNTTPGNSVEDPLLLRDLELAFAAISQVRRDAILAAVNEDKYEKTGAARSRLFKARRQLRDYIENGVPRRITTEGNMARRAQQLRDGRARFRQNRRSVQH